MLRVLPLTDELRSVWDRHVRASPDGWMFALTAWQDLILRVPRWKLKDQSFGVFDDGQLAAVMPLQFSEFTGRTTSSGWSGSGPVIDAAYFGKDRDRIFNFVIGEALRRTKRNSSAIFDYWVPPVTRTSLQHAWPTHSGKFRDMSLQSQIIDLSPIESELAAGMKPDARRMLRRATEAGVTVCQVKWPEFLESYYQAHCTTYTRTGVPPHPKEYFAGIANYMAPLGHSILFAAFRDGEPIAFVNVARFGEGAFYHTGCSIESASKLGANYALIWNALLWCKWNDVRYFDMGTVFTEAKEGKVKGLTTFKSKFGGVSLPFFRCEYDVDVPTPLLKKAVSAACRAAQRAKAFAENRIHPSG